MNVSDPEDMKQKASNDSRVVEETCTGLIQLFISQSTSASSVPARADGVGAVKQNSSGAALIENCLSGQYSGSPGNGGGQEIVLKPSNNKPAMSVPWGLRWRWIGDYLKTDRTAIKRIEDEKNRAGQQEKKLRDQIKKLEKSESSAKSEARKFQVKLKRLKHSTSAQLAWYEEKSACQMSNHQQEIQNLRVQFRKELNAQHQREMHYERKLEQLTLQNERLYYDQEKRVRTAQDTAKTMMEGIRSKTLSDDDIESHFNSKSLFWYNWARENGHEDMLIISDLIEEDRAMFHDDLKQCFRSEDCALPRELLQGMGAKYTPALLLQALLANFSCTRIIAKPFWIFDAIEMWFKEHPEDERKPETPGSSSSQQVEIILAQLNAVRCSDAQQWRAQTVQIMAVGVEEAVATHLEAGTTLLLDAISLYEESLVNLFLNGAAKFLLKLVDDRGNQSVEALREDIRESLIFSLRLWSQKSKPCIYGIEKFALVPFRHDDQMLKLYHSQDPAGVQIHDPDDDDEDEEEDNEGLYDGLPICIVVQPAIVAFGNQSGENYSSMTRIWSRGIVWVQGSRQRLLEKRRRRVKEKETSQAMEQ